MAHPDPPAGIERLLQVMARLRDPQRGCPWDLEQSFRTIAPHTIEEAYEVADAIERDDMGDLKDELGDLLFQVVFYAQMASEAGGFDFDSVAAAIADKMIDRHPHVFGEEQVHSAGAQTDRWETRKADERARRAEMKGHAFSHLDGVIAGLPALTRALKLQKRAARVGFDWPDKLQILDKIEEEIAELRAELEDGRQDRIEDELGDLMFALVNLARRVNTDPESALRHTNGKFERRFRFLEAALTAQGKDPAATSLDEMEALWQQAKGIEASSKS